MARTALIVTAAAMVMTALPFASATSSDADLATNQAQQASAQLPAMNANMLSMNMCSQRDEIVSELEKHFNESVSAVGMVDNNAVVEVYVSESGSWTILATGTDGNSCIVSAGEGWESTAQVRGADA